MFRRIATLVALLPAAALAAPEAVPSPSNLEVRPAALEFNWTPMVMPDGGHTAFASLNYLVAIDDAWSIGPGVYGTAKGNYGGIFTVGFTGQRRWQLSEETHLAAGLYVGAGGGLSSPDMHFGGGLMLRPELSLRTRFGAWYGGVGFSQIRFPSGNVKGDVGLAVTVGRYLDFAGHAMADAGRRGHADRRSGLGFDEISLTAGGERPSASSRDRSGKPYSGAVGKAGADLRQYGADGRWWGVEAAGAAQGGVDGYMEVLGQVGQDWAVGTPPARRRPGRPGPRRRRQCRHRQRLARAGRTDAALDHALGSGRAGGRRRLARALRRVHRAVRPRRAVPAAGPGAPARGGGSRGHGARAAAGGERDARPPDALQGRQRGGRQPPGPRDVA